MKSSKTKKRAKGSGAQSNISVGYCQNVYNFIMRFNLTNIMQKGILFTKAHKNVLILIFALIQL